MKTSIKLLDANLSEMRSLNLTRRKRPIALQGEYKNCAIIGLRGAMTYRHFQEKLMFKKTLTF